MMDSHKQLFCLILFLVSLLSGQTGMQVQARQRHQLNYHYPSKLFIFGDSYVDTGNTDQNDSNAWKEPYGITFPGKPAGRFSDGRVLTDYIAKYLGLKSPVPYQLWKQMPDLDLKYGMNFAVGGTGVFVKNPNMTTQIDFLKQLFKQKVYNTSDLSNSVALVSVAGNDYISYLVNNGSIQGLPFVIFSVVMQATATLTSIQSLGVKKIVVDGLQPVGCLPYVTASSSFKECNSTINNKAVGFHNTLLNLAVTFLNQASNGSTTFLYLDLYDAFMSVLNHPTTYNIQNPLQPCCVGISGNYYCGSVGTNNEKKYKVCDEPKSAFFWDALHPTQAGWHAVYNKLRTMKALEPLLN